MTNLIFASVDVLDCLITILLLAIFLRAILSWLHPDPKHRLIISLNFLTRPVLKPLQHFIPSFYGIDISPVIAIFALILLQRYALGFILSFIQT